MTITMARKQTTSRIICMLLLPVLTLLFTSGCATNLSKPARAPQPAKVKLGEFENVEMKAVGIAEKFASAPANQKALKKIDVVLFRNMRMLFPILKRIEHGVDFSRTTKRTLQITPHVKEIKFVGGSARFWAGSMAGSSAVLMQATLRDSSNGEIIADEEFYRDAAARAGGWTMGATDNRMLEEIAQDIVTYCSYNR